MVLECGEIDLARLLQKREAARREQGIAAADLDENFIRLYWEQMLTVRAVSLETGVLLARASRAGTRALPSAGPLTATPGP